MIWLGVGFSLVWVGVLGVVFVMFDIVFMLLWLCVIVVVFVGVVLVICVVFVFIVFYVGCMVFINGLEFILLVYVVV